MSNLATNPETGETLFYDGSAWGPAKVAENPETGERVAWDGTAWKSVGRVATPDSATAAVGAAVRGAGAETIAKKKIAEAMRPGDVIEAAAHSASFGFSDEAQAFLASLAGDDYDTELQGARDRLDDFRERSPVGAFASELLGGILVPGVGFSRALKASTMLGKGVRLAGAGAGAGAVAGFGVGEGGFDERLGSARTGALIGGIAAPALVGAANLAGRGLGALSDLTGLSNVTGRSDLLANRKVLQSLERVGLGPEDAAAKLDDMRSAGTTPALMDLGQNPARLTAAAARVPGKGAEIAADFVEMRQVGQADRVASVVDDVFGTNKSAAAFVDDLNSTQKLAAKPLYDQALQSQAVVDTAPLLARISDDLQDAVGPEQAALKRVASFLVRQADDGSIVPKTDIASLHKVKIGIDGLIENAGTDSAIGRAGRRTLTQLKAELLTLMDAAEPSYAAARAQWAGAMALEDAVEAGRDAIVRRMNPEEMASVYAKLTPAEQPAFRIGIVDALKKAIGEGGDGRNKVLALFGSPHARARLEAVLGQEEFARLAKFMGIEKAMSKAQAKVSGNSLTAERLADDADRAANPVDLLVNSINSPRSVLSNLMRMAGGYTQGLNEKTAANIVGQMTEMDPTKLRAIIDLLSKFGAEDAARMANPLRQGMTYGVGLGGVTLPSQQRN